ncbi:MAG: hypothetical protein VB140_03950 [Burkholderia sp.]
MQQRRVKVADACFDGGASEQNSPDYHIWMVLSNGRAYDRDCVSIKSV